MIYIKSVWLENLNIREFQKLEGDQKTDILIIGGGIAGVLCAYFLNRLGVDYMLVEGQRIGMGITKNTTAELTFQHGLIYDKLIKKFGKMLAKQYLEANKSALETYKLLCHDIDCDFEEKSAFTYSIYGKEKIENEIRALEKLEYNAEFVSEIPFPFKISGAVKFQNQAQFNPLKFFSKISENLNIYENTFVRDIQGNTAFTDHGKITTKKIIVATHFPFINTHGLYFLKMYQERSYVVAVENAPNVGGMYLNEAENGMYFRNYKDLLFIGGGDHRTGKKGGTYNEIREFIKKYYPESKEKYSWATQDCMTLNRVPYIGQYSKNTPDLFVATGFNKWGMTSSMVAAQILCDLVFEKKNDFAEIFSPSRSIFKLQLFINLGEILKTFVTPTAPRCPHLGCPLKWNKCERSWDCPCHGSRFEKDGKLIDNPAMEDANV